MNPKNKLAEMPIHPLMYTMAVLLMLGTSLAFTLVGLLFSNQIATALTNDPELQELCQEYLSVNLVFCWGIFLQTYGQQLLQAVGDTVLSMVSLIIGTVVNIILIQKQPHGIGNHKQG